MEYIFSEEAMQKLSGAEIDFTITREDSKVPYLAVDWCTGKTGMLAFRKDGINYFLDNEHGHVAYKNSNGIAKTWQLSRREYDYARFCLLEMLDNCDQELVPYYSKAISKLDYRTGKANAHFVVNASYTIPNEVSSIRFNLGNLFYTLNTDDGLVLKANINDPWACFNKKEVKGIEKRLVLEVIKRSKTVKEKIASIEG